MTHVTVNIIVCIGNVTGFFVFVLRFVPQVLHLQCHYVDLKPNENRLDLCDCFILTIALNFFNPSSSDKRE